MGVIACLVQQRKTLEFDRPPRRLPPPCLAPTGPAGLRCCEQLGLRAARNCMLRFLVSQKHMDPM